ncbi:transporter substrate-binding domain-containing protein [Oceanicella actignis]|uniref:Cyclohexadienyl dehydratase n=1 Tax=Oceanicella actignis TaxID=1189325 RepID=A0A1M7THA7_9RHOB|nr:transporter substrate-binding domain-containing protein [Oceanicella actignis]TYO88456.1 amino acid ABC transporter substrate-binding protein (PAAT family) [Oceanicella actignis]SET58919.1 amino acid ABC transporter substrate-binding protein, PAAT family [Oceanicella actignis]SHN70159.1 cyclohexadienyl dehydratase [Oceanicella actignis]
MKNFIAGAIAALGLGALSLAAGPAAAQSALQDILQSGKLKVGVTGDWNPMSMRDPATNTFQGYDIDVTRKLAEDLGVEVEYVPTDWKTLVNGVTSGKYHITGSASISPARLKSAGFSDSYLTVAILPFTTRDKLPRFAGWDSIDNPQTRVATTLGTTFERMVKDWFPNAQRKTVEAPARGYQEVLSGRADVFITSNVEGATLTKKYPDLVQIPVDKPRAPSAIAMLLPQADQVWINYVNHWIRIRKLSGFFDETAAKWGLAPPS